MSILHASQRPAVDLPLLIVRVVVGTIMVAHGAQKLFDMFDGPGLIATVEKMGQIGYLVAVGGCLGGIGIIVGFLTRFSAAANIIIMRICADKHISAKLYSNPPALMKKPFFPCTIAMAPIIAGPGKWSIGRVLPLPKSLATVPSIPYWKENDCTWRMTRPK